MALLEREHLLEELSRLVGRGAFAAILGEAGVGKTSLLLELARRADKMRVLIAGCEALFTPRPLGPFYDIAHELGIDPGEPRERLFPHVLAAAGREPTLLIIEDVHWADRATLDLLKYLARRISATPVLLAVSYRDDEVGPDHPLITVIGEAGRALKRIVVPPLSREAVESLGGNRRGLYELTGGNPFYVTEVLASDEGVPATVRDAVLARAAVLSPAARRVIEIASLVPGRAELSLIDANADDLETAARSGIVRIENDAIVFRHELSRRAIEDSLTDVRRIPMHRAILAKLRKGGHVLARLAHHAAGARDAQAIVEYAPLAAAEAAKADAHREAAAHYRNTIAYAGALPREERAPLLELLAYECYLTEQLDEALQRRSEALEIWRAIGDRLREGDNLRWQSRLLWFLGRNTEARQKALEAIEVLQALPEGFELAMAYSNRSQLHMLAQEVDDAIAWGMRAIEIAARHGDDLVLAHALNNVGTAEMQSGGSAEKLECSLLISLQYGYQEHAARAYTNLASQLVGAANYEAGRRYLDEGIAWCRDRDLDSWMLYMTTWRARLLLETGEWQAAADFAQSVLRHRGASAISRIPALAVLGRVRARRNDPGAQPLLDEGRDLARETGEFQRIAPIAAARAEMAWLRGETTRIAEEVSAAFAASERVHAPWERGELALQMWRGGAITSPPDKIAEPYALQIAGRWREAAAAFDAASRPYEAAIALTDGDDTDAIQQAMATLERLGDGHLRERLQQKLRALGVRGPHPSTREHPAGLTVREIEILQLLDLGLRNADIAERLFVSAKTVDHHVSSILNKLGAKTRGEAARLYRTQK